MTLIYLLMFLALCSMFYGNLSALVQTDIKRMLGFSGIAHAGFILLGLLTLDAAGYAIAMYYIAGYVVMNLACFLVLCAVSQEGENLAIEDLKGLHQRQPVLAFILAVGLFALAGIPPFVGFMGKFMLLTGALKAGGESRSTCWWSSWRPSTPPSPSTTTCRWCGSPIPLTRKTGPRLRWTD